MSCMAEAATGAATEMTRFADGSVNPREVLRQLAESVANEVMSAEADQPCEATGNSRNGYRERMPATCVASPERMAGAVMCERDEEWSRPRYFSGRVMPELPDVPLSGEPRRPPESGSRPSGSWPGGPPRRASSLRTSWRRRGIAG